MNKYPMKPAVWKTFISCYSPITKNTPLVKQYHKLTLTSDIWTWTEGIGAQVNGAIHGGAPCSQPLRAEQPSPPHASVALTEQQHSLEPHSVPQPPPSLIQTSTMTTSLCPFFPPSEDNLHISFTKPSPVWFRVHGLGTTAGQHTGTNTATG